MTRLWNRLRDACRKLRWRLTLSYTAVTVGALTTALIIAGILLFSRILMPTGVVTPEIWLQAVGANKSPLWSHILRQSPVDTREVALLLDTVETTDFAVGRIELLRLGGMQLSAQMAGESDILIVDADGTLLGSTAPHLTPPDAIGQPIDMRILPAMETPLRAALAGSTDPASLYAEIVPDEHFILIIPMYDEPEYGGELLGAGIAHVSRLPTTDDLPATTTMLALRGALLFLLAAGLLGAIFGLLTANSMAKRFERLQRATAAWSKGDFSARIDDQVGDEISQLAGRMNRMAGQLGEVVECIQQAAITEERNRLARDLHDSAKQQALAASFQLGTALTLFDEEPAAARRHLAEADALVDVVRTELTNLIYELRPAVTEERDFAETVREYAAEWAHRNGIVADVDADAGGDLPLEIKGELYRILQEALANVARHSKAGRVEIALQWDDSSVKLSVVDDGCGFEAGAPAGGMGIRSMRERAEALGGKMHVESRPAHGTAVTVMLPAGG